MSKYITFSTLGLLLATLFLLSWFLGSLTQLHAQESSILEISETYIPVSPLPLGPDRESEVHLSDPGGYLVSMFTIFLSVIAILAVIRLVLCGFQYMLSESISTKESAKKCIWAIVFGIAIILLSVMVLAIINPELTQLKFFDRFQSEFSRGFCYSSHNNNWFTADEDTTSCYHSFEQCQAEQQQDESCTTLGISCGYEITESCSTSIISNSTSEPFIYQDSLGTSYNVQLAIFEQNCTTGGGIVTVDPDTNIICEYGS